MLLNRSRSPIEIPPVKITVAGKSLKLEFDSEWLEANPLTIADLEREVGYLGSIGYELSFS